MPVRNNEFCGAEPYADDWSAKTPVWYPRPGRHDAVDRIIEEMWQKPSGVVYCTAVVEDRSLADRLREQADKWARETGHLSSPTQRAAHPSYQAILGMGRENKSETLRFLLRDLKENRRAWFWALSYLAQDNPIKQKDAGKMDKMIDAWVNWGKARGLL